MQLKVIRGKKTDGRQFIKIHRDELPESGVVVGFFCGKEFTLPNKKVLKTTDWFVVVEPSMPHRKLEISYLKEGK